jgi:hypothetical protein
MPYDKHLENLPPKAANHVRAAFAYLDDAHASLQRELARAIADLREMQAKIRTQ